MENNERNYICIFISITLLELPANQTASTTVMRIMCTWNIDMLHVVQFNVIGGAKKKNKCIKSEFEKRFATLLSTVVLLAEIENFGKRPFRRV